MPLGNVYYGQPVNRAHPLHRGCTALLQAVPNFVGSPIIKSLQGVGGSLTMTASTAGWLGYGFGTKTVPGSSLGTFTVPSAIDTSTGGSEISIEFVATWLGTDSGTANISGCWRLGTTYFLRLGDSDLTNTQANLHNATTRIIVSTTNIVARRRFSILCTANNSNGVDMYLDGASVGTASYTGNFVGSSFNMFADDSGSRAGAMMLHRFAVWNRRLTASDAVRLSDEAQRDWPTLLTRVHRRKYAFAVAAPPAASPSYLTLLGVG